ncbi:MAG: hypothetical protein ABFD07_19115 [Methanobacterium sp.]
MKLLPFISLFFIALLATSASAAYVTPEKDMVTDLMNNYDLGGQNNSLQLACSIGQYVSSEYGWNCDIRQLNFTKHAPVYINVFYPAANNKKGYEAYYGWFGPQKKEVTSFTGKDKKMYYRDWYEPGHECYVSGLKSYGIVESYFGNVTEETDPEVIPEENNTTPPEDSVIIINDSQDGNKTVIINSGEIKNTVENSTNTVQNQGFIDSVRQYWFDLKNANLSNVTFNFFGGN